MIKITKILIAKETSKKSSQVHHLKTNFALTPTFKMNFMVNLLIAAHKNGRVQEYHVVHMFIKDLIHLLRTSISVLALANLA